MQQSIIMHFQRSLVDRPIISHMIQTFGLEVNILQAYITPDEGGHMFSILQGEEEAVSQALAYLDGLKVKTILPTRNLVMDEDKCVHCGACVGACGTGALSVDPDTARIVYENRKCIACELCIPACAYGAIESISDHLRKKGEL
jgi:ferredoxin